MAVTQKPVRVFAGTKAIAISNDNLITQNGSLSISLKQALQRINRRNGGTTLILTSDSTAKTSTTLTNVTDSATASTGVVEMGYFDLIGGGNLYLVDCALQITNGTAANGAKAAITLSGTQSGLVATGQAFALGSGAAGAVADQFPIVGLSSNLFFTLSPDTTSPFVIAASFIVKAIDDGRLQVQFAEKDAGGGTAVLKATSYVQVRPLVN